MQPQAAVVVRITNHLDFVVSHHVIIMVNNLGTAKNLQYGVCMTTVHHYYDDRRTPML